VGKIFLQLDITITKQLIDMGIDELSVAPNGVLNVRKAIRDVE
jgi:phosphoenolpyruvate-protein kinase (PTS system EI component)